MIKPTGNAWVLAAVCILVPTLIFFGLPRSRPRPEQTSPTTQPVARPLLPDDPLGACYPAARRALNLLYAHESQGGTNLGGDAGLARGCLHQHEDNWHEGCEWLGVDWKWPEDTSDREKCEHVAMANWFRYARPYLDAGNLPELILRFRLPFDPYRLDNLLYLQAVLTTRPTTPTPKGDSQ